MHLHNHCLCFSAWQAALCGSTASPTATHSTCCCISETRQYSLVLRTQSIGKYAQHRGPGNWFTTCTRHATHCRHVDEICSIWRLHPHSRVLGVPLNKWAYPAIFGLLPSSHRPQWASGPIPGLARSLSGSQPLPWPLRRMMQIHTPNLPYQGQHPFTAFHRARALVTNHAAWSTAQTPESLDSSHQSWLAQQH